MKIKAIREYMFSDLVPGEVFMYGEICCMKMSYLQGYNAVNLEDGHSCKYHVMCRLISKIKQH